MILRVRPSQELCASSAVTNGSMSVTKGGAGGSWAAAEEIEVRLDFGLNTHDHLIFLLA